MADGITAPLTGSGDSTAKIATDDAGTPGHVQIVKLAISTDGSATIIPADATNGIYANVKALPGTVQADIATLAGGVGGTEYQADVVTMPAADRTTDTVGAALVTDKIMNDTTELTPKFAKIACASSGNNTIVSAVSAKKIRVLSVALVASAATNIYFADSAGSPVALFGDSTNKANLAANSGFVLPFNPTGWFETSTTNVAIVLNLSAANGVGGCLTYIEV
jgi:hypothetical protein